MNIMFWKQLIARQIMYMTYNNASNGSSNIGHYLVMELIYEQLFEASVSFITHVFLNDDWYA